MRFSRMGMVGMILGIGVLLTGCGTLFADSEHSGQSALGSLGTTAGNQHGKGVAVRTTALQEGASNRLGNAHAVQAPSGPQYPDFGIGTTGPEVLALNERLAELGYLPVMIQGNTLPQISLNNIQHPPSATFIWKYGNIPSQLQALWQPDTYTAITRAAVIAVEHVNGLAIDGIAGPEVWQSILASHAIPDPHRYTYVLVAKDPAPETLRIWKAGNWIYQSVCNTGISDAVTQDGTYAIYLRYLSQTMKGKNPNGTRYSDAGIPDVNYFHGSEAIHGFIRAQYGFPQSLGCVELPYAHAAQVWPLVHYGTLVTIQGHYVPPSQPTNTQTSTAPTSSTNPVEPSPSVSSSTSATGGTSNAEVNGSSANQTNTSGSNTTAGNSPAIGSNATGTGQSTGSNATGTGQSTGSNATGTGQSTGSNATGTGGQHAAETIYTQNEAGSTNPSGSGVTITTG